MKSSSFDPETAGRTASAHETAEATGTHGLPIAPSLSPALQTVNLPRLTRPVDRRVVFISAIALVLGGLAGVMARALTALIAIVTNISFYGTFSMATVAPADNTLGWFVVLPPVIGGVLVGFMARYGSKAIRGHGIPEAMEQVLFNRSRIAPRLTLLKPLSSAVAIGTGGPFGAEGPIIATGGALGSLIGQAIEMTAVERKTLLAAGAAAGMAATFGTPVAAVLLAVELLLFEFRARSIIPVSLASAVATAVHIAFEGGEPMFPMADLAQPGAGALTAYVVLGAIMGLAAVGATRAVYGIEDAFERLPIHWMWWPAIGGIGVGVVGYFAPETMGVGYDNIHGMLTGALTWRTLLLLGALKFVSWSIALGSGTSGGTLAPLFTVGGAIAGAAGMGAAAAFPEAGIDPRMASLVGMTAFFTGASHALLTWVVFAFETTRQDVGLLPLLGGCAAAYLISMLSMRYSIMTEKIARRGVPVARGYEVDHLRQQLVKAWAAVPVRTLRDDERLEDVRARLSADATGWSHQGFPVLDIGGRLTGVISRRDIFSSAPGDTPIGNMVRRPPAVIFDDSTLREAADQMVQQKVGRLPVVTRADPGKVIGIITRSDLLMAHSSRLEELHIREDSLFVRRGWIRRTRRSAQKGPRPL